MVREQATGAAAEPDAGWPAVQRLARYLLHGVQPGEQQPPIPEVLNEWPTTVLPAIGAGLLYGITSKWGDERKRHGPVPPSVNLRMGRFFRISDAAVRSALPMAAMAALFLGVEALAAVHRGRQCLPLDSMLGSTVVAGVYAAHHIGSTPIWPPARLGTRAAIVVALCSLQGAVQQSFFKQKQAEEATAAEAEAEWWRAEIAASRRSDAVSDLLAQLEARLQASPSEEPPAAVREGTAGEQQAGQRQQQDEEGAGEATQSAITATWRWWAGERSS